MQSILVCSLLAAGAFSAPTPATSPSQKVPLPKRAAFARSTGTLDTTAYLANLNHTIQKYSGKSLRSYGISAKHKRQSAKEALTDQISNGEDELYYGPGSVGAESGFTFDFDTGSADTFIPGPSCGTAQGCVGTVKYGNNGTDEGNTTSITYGSGSVQGENYYDSVTVAGLTAKHQNVISLTQAAGFSSSNANSLMGMGFQAIAASGQPPYFKTLIDQKQVTTQEFSFYLGRAAGEFPAPMIDKSNIKNGTGAKSEMTLGGRDTSKFTGTPVQVAVSTPGYWQIPLDGVKVNAIEDLVDQIADKGQAAIDTGTTIILAPLLAATTIFARIPGAIPVPLALLGGAVEPILYIYPCAMSPNVSITFGGTDFAIDPRDFNLGQLTPDFGTLVGNATLASVLKKTAYCVAAIAAFDIQPAENLYVVGDTFLKNWYSIYSYNAANGSPAVSFAKSVSV
ncbi:hypothetical protein LTR85_002728 [Meristemomyces frigidus]|nr:hypothetical protein LTR85_002728 [Meristemomyces frigidus]